MVGASDEAKSGLKTRWLRSPDRYFARGDTNVGWGAGKPAAQARSRRCGRAGPKARGGSRYPTVGGGGLSQLDSPDQLTRNPLILLGWRYLRQQPLGRTRRGGDDRRQPPRRDHDGNHQDRPNGVRWPADHSTIPLIDCLICEPPTTNSVSREPQLPQRHFTCTSSTSPRGRRRSLARRRNTRLCGGAGETVTLFIRWARVNVGQRGVMWWFLAGVGIVAAAGFFVVRATVHAIAASGTDTLG
jgi:hypothetical protein